MRRGSPSITSGYWRPSFPSSCCRPCLSPIGNSMRIWTRPAARSRPGWRRSAKWRPSRRIPTRSGPPTSMPAPSVSSGKRWRNGRSSGKAKATCGNGPPRSATTSCSVLWPSGRMDGCQESCWSGTRMASARSCAVCRPAWVPTRRCCLRIRPNRPAPGALRRPVRRRRSCDGTRRTSAGFLPLSTGTNRHPPPRPCWPRRKSGCMGCSATQSPG